jgi:tRNA pseudouridine55 synthase
MPPEAPSEPRDGVVVIDKGAGWTSHDVVAKARGRLGTRKVGHAGTLDPSATGVLVLGVGRATRLLRYAQLLPKRYEAEIVLGVETATLDADGEVLATRDASAVTPDAVRAAAGALTGDILQVPPMVSAVKVDGRRLHELARAGIEVERAARPVHVWQFDVVPDPIEAHIYHATVECSSGTYVRTLAADVGTALGCGAHLRNLRRTSVGSFTLDGAHTVETLEPEHVEPIERMIEALEQVEVPDELAARVRVGAVLERDVLGATGDGPCAVLTDAGTLLAVYEPHRGTTMKPAVVVAP